MRRFLTRFDRRIAVAGICALLAIPAVWRGLGAFLSERAQSTAARWSVAPPPDAASLGLHAAAFPSRDGSPLRGWWASSRNGAAIVLCHGTGADRRALLGEARALIAAGFGVLVYDAPGHGESGGDRTFGAPEHDALEGALDYVVAHADVRDGRIGVLGFSQGAHVAAVVAGRDPRIRAVVLAGAADGLATQTRAEYARGGPLAQWGALVALHLAGGDRPGERPIDVIAALAPRPVVLVAGTADRTVPLPLTRALFDASRPPHALWVITGAEHGTYLAAEPAYGARLRKFFTDALLGAPSGTAPTVPGARELATPAARGALVRPNAT